MYAPDDYYWSREVLKISDLRESQLVTPRTDSRYIEGAIIPPGNATVSRVLTPTGGINKQGLAALDDKEFVWPYLDTPYPFDRMFTELQVSKQWERLWMEHYYGYDKPPPPLEVGGHTDATFALVYAKHLREMGRAGAGTKLGRWLDAWLERADAEETRLGQL